MCYFAHTYHCKPEFLILKVSGRSRNMSKNRKRKSLIKGGTMGAGGTDLYYMA